MEVFEVAANVRSFVNASMKQWNTELIAGNQRLGNVKIKRGALHSDGLSPLPIILVMIPLRICSEDIKMEFGLPKCGVLIMKKRKLVKREGISTPDRTMIKNIEEGLYKYLEILEADGIQHDEMKGQIKK